MPGGWENIQGVSDDYAVLVVSIPVGADAMEIEQACTDATTKYLKPTALGDQSGMDISAEYKEFSSWMDTAVNQAKSVGAMPTGLYLGNKEVRVILSYYASMLGLVYPDDGLPTKLPRNEYMGVPVYYCSGEESHRHLGVANPSVLFRPQIHRRGADNMVENSAELRKEGYV